MRYLCDEAVRRRGARQRLRQRHVNERGRGQQRRRQRRRRRQPAQRYRRTSDHILLYE